MFDTNKLDSHGKLSIVELAFYVPAILFCIFNNIRYGFRREAGWIYLSIFCIIKLVGAGMNIDIELNNKTSLITTATILNSIALSPLLSATLSFVNGSMDKKSKSERYSGPVLTFSRLLKPVHIVIIIALVLSISGTMDRTKTDQNSIDTGANLVKISVVLFLIVWGILCMASLCFYAVRSRFSPMQRILIVTVLLALPFLLVRVIYSGLNAINLDTSTSTGHTQKFNPVTGSWSLYLILGLLPEAIVVALYSVAGVLHFIKSRKAERFGNYSEVDLADTSYLPQSQVPLQPSYC